MSSPRSARRLFRFALWIAAALGAAAAGAGGAPRAEFIVGAIAGPGFSVAGGRVVFDLAAAGAGEALLRDVRVGGRALGDVRLQCSDLRLYRSGAECRDGRLGGVPARWRLGPGLTEGWLRLAPAPGERWEVRLRPAGTAASVEIHVERGRAERLRGFLPAGAPLPGAGTVSGSLSYVPGAGGEERVDAALAVQGLAFADAAGLRAAEGVAAALTLTAVGRDARWSWEASVDWPDGAMFWDPLYVPAGLSATARGSYADGTVKVTASRSTLPGKLTVSAAGAWDGRRGGLDELALTVAAPDLAAAFGQWAAPLLAGGRWERLRVAGRGELTLSLADGAWKAARLRLDAAAAEDPGAALAIDGVAADLPWRADAATDARVAWRGGGVYGIPIGAAAVALEVLPDGVRLARAEVPVLDGTLTLNDGRLAREADGWRWEVRGALSALSMEKLTGRLGWPAMGGSLAAVVPRVAYRDRVLDVDGALLFRVFDGTVVARGLRLEDPLGRAPRLEAELEMRGLDLDLLTRAFSFGSIEGRIDADVRGLELANWTPVAFDARIASSPGEYPRTISQRAVENISALGGAGAAAAVQRTFLRFFERFGYRRLGVSCVLRDGVCRMDGVAPAPRGYVIVEGGGVPAITVIGYNRAVGWNELVSRLKRVTADNVAPVVQ